jgi:hypothetical protein
MDGRLEREDIAPQFDAGLDVAFRGESPTTDPACCWERSDVNCDGVLDVIRVIKLAFRVPMRHRSSATHAYGFPVAGSARG